MSDILSQNEIDALLSAITTGEMDAEELKREDEERKVKVYDFKRALRFSKDQIRSLTRIHENYARLLTTLFSAQLRTYVDITVASVEQLPYEEFIRSVPSMTIMNVFEAAPLEGRMLIEVNPNISFAMLDRLLGGKGESVNKVENLTEIETKLMKQLFENSLDAFQEAWESIIEIEPTMLDFEVNPQFLQLVSPNETVVVISLTMSIAETSGLINICIPHVVLEPVIPNLSMHYWMQTNQKARSEYEVELLQKRVQQAHLPIVAQLGTSEININDFLHLNTNDVIRLEQKISEPLLIKIGETPKFLGQPGKIRNRMAIQILEVMKEGVNLDD
ncbi:flagellar motor switch protein FliM [Pueribacillus theae]|uniref:Flagellar motor switch protein FliM n=1 Tax=Pueribacillus theae TaxID=2171751 RepID=A0A2U1K7X9_9BACI|nr:flagellar motor switch protein FliM [Pueribacillus theae]PWA13512.1 flagellar motor switch protein FliM [Pueribacillus theae]